jgi:hypothetical protein
MPLHLHVAVSIVVALALILSAPAGASQAQFSDGSSSITLERTSCFGPCPTYKVTIHGDGTVEYEGFTNVRVVGKATSRIRSRVVDELRAEFERIGFWGLRKEYTSIDFGDGTGLMVSDRPTAITSFSSGGRTKTVSDYLGAPQALRDLEKRIDAEAGTKRWVAVDAPTVRELVRAGWDPHSPMAIDLLKGALGSDDLDVARALLEAGVDVNSDTVRVLSAARTERAMRLLMPHVADVNVSTSRTVVEHITALMNAARDTDAGGVRVLVEAGADVNAIDASGRTALMNAAIAGRPDTVRLLLAAGALRYVRDNNGFTALDFAIRGADDEVANRPHREQMRAAGFPVETPDFDVVIQILKTP